MTEPRPHISAAAVQARLQDTLAPERLEVIDDSAAHAGHAGAREGSHLRVLIVSPRFVGVPRLARHRLVYDALSTLMPRGIHALVIEARAPGEP
ncbi:MAG: BolA family protein [Burkholderiaceae bacterium]